MEPYRDLGTFNGLSGFEGAQGKIVRVRYQLRDLKQRFEDFAGAHPYRVTDKFELRPGEQIGDYSFILESIAIPKREWGVLIGEIIHNLRSALDHTIWASAKKPTDETQFPIFTRRCDWEKKADKMIATVPKNVLALIEKTQPYNSPEGTDPRQHLLAVLNRLSNYDKHRLLHTAALSVHGAAPGIEGTGQFGTIREIETTFGPVEPGDTLVRITLENPPPETKLNLYGDFALGVAFRDPTGRDKMVDGSPVFENLLGIYRFVGSLVTEIEATALGAIP